MKTTPFKTPHGIIYGRNALIIKKYEFSLSPLSAMICCLLSLSKCIPEIIDSQHVDITLMFKNAKSINIYKLDDYPQEAYTSPSLDVASQDNPEERYILSTYDYVFDIVGRLEIPT